MRVLLSLYANLFAGTESAGVVEQECPPLQKSSQYNRFTTHSPRNRMPLSRRLASHGVTLGGRWVGLIILGYDNCLQHLHGRACAQGRWHLADASGL